jgi:hypothetical protein
MAGHSRPKDGVASLAYVPAIHDFALRLVLKTWMPATSAGMTLRARHCRSYFFLFHGPTPQVGSSAPLPQA